MIQALEMPWEVEPEGAVAAAVPRNSEMSFRHWQSRVFGFPLSLSPPLSELNLRPRQHQKSGNRKIRAFIIRNSLCLLSGLDILNRSNSAANTYLPRKSFSFKPSTYPTKERGAGSGSWHSHGVGKNNTLGLLFFGLVRSCHSELVSCFAYIDGRQVPSLQTARYCFWCQSWRKSNTRAWAGFFVFFIPQYFMTDPSQQGRAAHWGGAIATTLSGRLGEKKKGAFGPSLARRKLLKTRPAC